MVNRFLAARGMPFWEGRWQVRRAFAWSRWWLVLVLFLRRWTGRTWSSWLDWSVWPQDLACRAPGAPVFVRPGRRPFHWPDGRV